MQFELHKILYNMLLFLPDYCTLRENGQLPVLLGCILSCCYPHDRLRFTHGNQKRENEED